MSEQQNVEIIRRGYDAFGRGDLNALLDLFDDDIEWTAAGPPELPTAGTRRGRAQVAEFFNAIGQIWEIQRFDPHTFIAQGDHVVVVGDDTARVKATGKVLDTPWVHVFTIRGGKVVRFQEFVDTAPTMAELRAAQVHR